MRTAVVINRQMSVNLVSVHRSVIIKDACRDGVHACSIVAAGLSLPAMLGLVTTAATGIHKQQTCVCRGSQSYSDSAAGRH